VAEAIVRFIAGGSELRNAEVEPSLLSLICRELNNTRIAQGRDEPGVVVLLGRELATDLRQGRLQPEHPCLHPEHAMLLGNTPPPF